MQGDKNLLFVESKEEILTALRLIGGIECHAEAAFGYSFELKDGTVIQIGQSDDDISIPHIFWIKKYNKPVETEVESASIKFTKKEISYIIRNLNCKYRKKSVDEDERNYLNIYSKLDKLITNEQPNENPMNYMNGSEGKHGW